MLQSKLSTKGQIIIPKPLRAAHNWQPGQKLLFVDTPDGILLKAEESPFAETRLDDVAGCLHYKGKTKSLEEMEEAIAMGASDSKK